uniref:Si:dkey-7k24.5 n=1 Tax=Latimeria chalumnae TaxID=7897 RepID=H3B9M7_LATCH|nr:PREDICTED: somatomedin-B and thrombospondin type-1 domain-containing protein-like [Latimeria chalumnae]|eukprot:XP_005992107.1 PREDICTED: somatomedin-B and thrombospondin type-1 domain-containing protein-like [Latimeria chalumnae]
MDFSRLFAVICVGFILVNPRSQAGCRDEGFCCTSRNHTCVSTGWRADRSYGTCYCDQACSKALDCCHDYSEACPAVSCTVSEWSSWSGCAEPCKATYRVRRRQLMQEPRNGGDQCPPLEEKAGCAEYWNRQRVECRQSLVPALITTGGYGKARKRRDVSSENEKTGYCVEFQLKSLAPACILENKAYSRWMQYLREGHTVCVECQPPALNFRSQHCYGDGVGAKKNQLLEWQAVGNPQCRGSWKRIRQRDSCSCPTVHSFLFV